MQYSIYRKAPRRPRDSPSLPCADRRRARGRKVKTPLQIGDELTPDELLIFRAAFDPAAVLRTKLVGTCCADVRRRIPVVIHQLVQRDRALRRRRVLV